MLQTASPSWLAQVERHTTLPALSCTQPWATLMALGSKRIETRSWQTSKTGLVAIHAAKSIPEWAEDLCDDEPFRSTLSEAGYHWKPGVVRNSRGLPVGRVVAVGWLERVERITSDFQVASIERSFGNYAPGRYAWCFSQVYRLANPIAARGSLGLWQWQPPEEFWTEVQALYEQEAGVQ